MYYFACNILFALSVTEDNEMEEKALSDQNQVCVCVHVFLELLFWRPGQRIGEAGLADVRAPR